jgi:translation initiation factor RLI1
MAGKMAMVDFAKCHPAKCADGVCVAAQACPRKLMKQEQAGDIPMTNPSICKGCGDCARACPLKAIRVVTI